MKKRLWSKLDIRPFWRCWEYQGARHDRDHYGLFYANGKMVRAHRLSYELFNGKIPNGMCVMHTCDNPPCCNPNHLKLGTKRRNMEDAKEKDRHAAGMRHGKAILSNKLVRAIREQYARGFNAQEIKEAHCLTVALVTIERAATGVSWKHVPMPEGLRSNIKTGALES